MKRQNRLSLSLFVAGLLLSMIFLGEVTFASGKEGVEKIGKPHEPGITLIMFEQEGCHYCELWDKNIGVFYDKTPEGHFAPLRRVDIHMDDKVPNVKPVIFTPTFVLYKNGNEVGRLTGYMSDDFFWGLLSPMLKKYGYRETSKESNAAESLVK